VVESRVKAVLLDAGNTLVFLDGHRLRRVFASVGIEVDEATFAEAEFRARARLVADLSSGSNGMEPKAWKRYFRRIFRGVGVPWYRLRKVAVQAKAAHAESHLWSRVPSSIPPALQGLLNAGYRLGVISNADGSVEGLIESVGLSGYFEFVLDSGTLGWEKPDRRIFEAGLRQMGVEAHEALYAGDLCHVDVVGARSAGMRAVLVDPWHRSTCDADRISSIAELPDYVATLGEPPGG
jgi:putative hydrolase of the HAD superfamily